MLNNEPVAVAVNPVNTFRIGLLRAEWINAWAKHLAIDEFAGGRFLDKEII